MQPRITTVGPLASASATKIALAQSPGAAGALALNGAAGSFTANNICTSQTTSGAAFLNINGVLAVDGVAWIPNPPGSVYITSAGNDSSITFTVVGLDINSVSQTEILTGTDASVVACTKLYSRILSIETSGATSGSGVTVGSFAAVELDTARQVIFTSSGNDGGLTITISGTDWAGTPISETVTGGDAAAASTVLDYLTVSQVLVSGATAGTIEVGTSSIAGSPWINLDAWAHGAISGQCAVSGTVNYTVEITNDDPDSIQNPISRSAVTWDSTYVNLSAKTAEEYFGLAVAPAWMRVLLNSGSGSVRMSVIQTGAIPR